LPSTNNGMPRRGDLTPSSPSFRRDGDAALCSPPARASRVSDHPCLTARGGPKGLAPRHGRRDTNLAHPVGTLIAAIISLISPPIRRLLRH
jgi:hypothetical protein